MLAGPMSSASLLAPSEVHHWGLGTDTTGNAAFAERVKVFLAAFPDIQLTPIASWPRGIWS